MAVMETKKPELTDAVEVATRWGLVGLALLTVLGAMLRIFAPGQLSLPDRLDQTTLLYLGVAGMLLLLRQVKTFSLGQLKLEMIEKLREQQQKQEEKIADIALILPFLLQDKEVRHIRNLFVGQTEKYQGSGALREELRRLRSIGLISKKTDITTKDLVMRLDIYVGERDLYGVGFSDSVILGKQYYARALRALMSKSKQSRSGCDARGRDRLGSRCWGGAGFRQL